MSVVVAIVDKENDRVIMGADSQVTYGSTKQTLKNENNYKIFRSRNNVLFGIVGTLRGSNILKCEEDLVDELSALKGKIDFKYVVTKLVPKIFKIMKDNKLLIEEDNKETYLPIDILFAYKGTLFEISGDGSVIQIEDYIAIGSGYKQSIGYLNLNKPNNKNNTNH